MAFAAHGHNYMHGQYSHGRHHGDDESVKHARASVGFINDVAKLFQNKSSKCNHDVKEPNNPQQR